MAEHPRIALDPDVFVGKPVIRGTRLAVEFVIGLMAKGWSEADIFGNYPGVTHDDINRVSRLCARHTELGEGIPERSVSCASSPTKASFAQSSHPCAKR
jgi:uncharacterized protein (DUF433 family)